MLGRLLEKRFTPGPDSMFDPRRIPSNAEGFGADSGVPVNERTALQLVAVYACVRILADSIASLPIDVYRRRSGQVRDEVDPVPPVVREIDYEWLYQEVTSLALKGNGYAVVMERDALERPVWTLPVHPDHVRVEPVEGSDYDPRRRRWRYKIGGEIVPNEDVLHFRRFVTAGSPLGLSPIQAAAQAVGLGLAADRFGARWFRDGAAPSSTLSTEQSLTDEEVRRNQQSWVETHGGRRLPAVLSGGMKWDPVTITPDESQFLETRKFQRSEIAMMFGIPPHMIGDTEKSTSWGTGIEQQSIGFVVYTLRPWLTCIETLLSEQLPRGMFARFNIDALLRGDVKSRYEAYTHARQAGWMNVDEIRELEDRPPVPGGAGQDFIQPLNYGVMPVTDQTPESEGSDDE